MSKYIQNERGLVLVTAVVFSFVIALLGISYFRMGGLEGSLQYNSECSTQALYCADSGVEYSRFRLKQDSEWGNVGDVTDWGSIPIGSMGNTSIEFTFISSTAYLKRGSVICSGTVDNAVRTIKATIAKKNIDNMLDTLAAVTGPIQLNGGITLDGRNHDENGIWLDDDTGTYALRIPPGMTKDDVTAQSNNVIVNGTLYPGGLGEDKECDHEEFLNDADYITCIQSLIDIGNVHDAPYKVLQYESEEMLRQIAKDTGFYYNVMDNGGDPPGHGAEPDLVVSGLTYIDFTGMGDVDWNSPKLSGEGIVIIHNDGDSDVTVKSYNKDFKGVMIVDNMENFAGNGSIIGSLYVFNPNETNLGMGTANIKFSREVLSGVLDKFKLPYLTSWKEM